MRGLKQALLRSAAGLTALAAATAAAQADDGRSHLNNYGHSGLIDMPNARLMNDGEFAVTAHKAGDDYRFVLSFQPLPWLEANFRYSQIADYFTDPGDEGPLFDRSFGVKIRLFEEGKWTPAVAVGIQDLLGTGIFAGEYVVASKRFGDFDFTLGLGWGRLGSVGHFRNPLSLLSDRFDDREVYVPGEEGGVPLFNAFFRGRDVGVFGGVVWRTPIKGLNAIIEYSGDNYRDEVARGLTVVRSQVNYGLSYRFGDLLELSAAYLNGDRLNLRLTLRYDPINELPKPLDPAPLPPFVRTVEERARADRREPETFGAGASLQQRIEAGEWASTPALRGQIRDSLLALARDQGIEVEAIELQPNYVAIYYRNETYQRDTEAVHRLMRAITTLPPSVEYVYLTSVVHGAPSTELLVSRSAYERATETIGNGGDVLPYIRLRAGPTEIPATAEYVGDPYPRFEWSLAPTAVASLFDPDNLYKVGIGVQISGSIEPSPGLVFEGAFEAQLASNLDVGEPGESLLPRVASDYRRYRSEGANGIARLLVSKTGKLDDETWYRLSAGYFTDQFGGVGGEILYRPSGSRWSFGANAYYVRQRDFDRLFGFRDYDILTGHVSVYGERVIFDELDFNVHAGRYLAGDWGATFEITRRFESGVELGAYATFTDVPFDVFGEGSFDKGLILRFPLNWLSPFATQTEYANVLRSLTRDGGVRLYDINPLWDSMRRSDDTWMRNTWTHDVRPAL